MNRRMIYPLYGKLTIARRWRLSAFHYHGSQASSASTALPSGALPGFHLA